MQKIVIACLLLAGFIKFYPLVGVVSAAQLGQLYQMGFEDPSLQILMRHRAVLFGLLGGFVLLSAFRPALRPGAIVAGLISALAFIALVLLTTGHSPAIHRIMLADIVVVLALSTAWWLERAPKPRIGSLG